MADTNKKIFMSKINVDYMKFEKKSYTVLNLILIKKFSTVKKSIYFKCLIEIIRERIRELLEGI